ncbi:MAG: Na+/H+ antiporter subunit D [Pseudomonadota bacterium]
MASEATKDIEALKALSMIQDSPLLGDWLVIMPIVIPFLAASGIVMMRQRVDRHAELAMGTCLLMTLFNLALLLKVLREGVVVMEMGNWLPPFGIVFVVDAVGALFALTTSVLGFATAWYAANDLDMRTRRYGFFAFLMMLISGVSGAFLTGDVFNLYVWFEVLLIASFGLIIFGGEREQLDGAVRYAILNLIATTLFLIATGFLYGITGTLNFADLARVIPELPDSAPIETVGALYIFAFAMKAAAFPVGSWLPASYHTPKLVVGALFAGLLTKVGVYAIFRVNSLVFPTPDEAIRLTLLWVSLITMIVGVLGAIAQNDMRRTLGFLVVSGIGSMLLGVALGTENGFRGAVLYAVHSMVVMTALYLVVGIIQRATNQRLMTEISGLYRASSVLSIVFLILVFAVSGLPPFSGFWPKVALLEAAIEVDEGFAAFILLLTGLLTSIAMGRMWAHTFWKPAEALANQTVVSTSVFRDPGRMLPVALLVAIVIALGLFPNWLFVAANQGASGLIDPAAYIEATLAGTDRVMAGPSQ